MNTAHNNPAPAIAAKAATHSVVVDHAPIVAPPRNAWIPAFAGMTVA
jgi:hypothetical protein